MGKKLIRAHRASWLIYKGEIPTNLIVLHNCDNRACTNPNHLRLGTHKDNADDKYKRKRDKHLKGENHKSTILTEACVREIRNLLKNGISCRELATKFNVKYSVIYFIKKRRTWRGIE